MLLASIYDSVANSCEVFCTAKKDFEAANKGTKTKKTIVYDKEPEPGQPEVTVDDKNIYASTGLNLSLSTAITRQVLTNAPGE
jgi:hypothetical protein